MQVLEHRRKQTLNALLTALADLRLRLLHLCFNVIVEDFRKILHPIINLAFLIIIVLMNRLLKNP
jgi:hypothetical protein